jgi:hypothetical protein
VRCGRRNGCGHGFTLMDQVSSPASEARKGNPSTPDRQAMDSLLPLAALPPPAGDDTEAHGMDAWTSRRPLRSPSSRPGRPRPW